MMTAALAPAPAAPPGVRRGDMSHSGPSGTDLGPDQDGSSTYRSPSASTQAKDAARQTAGTTESVVPLGGARCF